MFSVDGYTAVLSGMNPLDGQIESSRAAQVALNRRLREASFEDLAEVVRKHKAMDLDRINLGICLSAAAAKVEDTNDVELVMEVVSILLPRCAAKLQSSSTRSPRVLANLAKALARLCNISSTGLRQFWHFSETCSENV